MPRDMVRTNRTIAVLLLLAAFSPRYFAQGGNPVGGAPTRVETPTPPLAGCYDLTLGRWWPWALGEDTGLITPPNRIQLLPERGTSGFEKGEFLIRRIPRVNSTTSGRVRSSYWQVKPGNQIDLVWNDGFTGVTLTLKKIRDELRGWAHPHFDYPHFVPRIARVTTRRIACDVSR